MGQLPMKSHQLMREDLVVWKYSLNGMPFHTLGAIDVAVTSALLIVLLLDNSKESQQLLRKASVVKEHSAIQESRDVDVAVASNILSMSSFDNLHSCKEDTNCEYEGLKRKQVSSTRIWPKEP